MNMRNRILVTGGCGFVGHHMVEYLLQNGARLHRVNSNG